MADQSTPKTILLAVNFGFVARYLLRTDIFCGLKERGLRLVILTPNDDEPYFRQEFEDEGVALAHYDFGRCQARLYGSRWEHLLRLMRWYSMPGIPTHSCVHARWRAFGVECRRGGLGDRLRYGLVALSRQALMHSPALRRLELGIEERLFAPDIHREVFDRHRPDLVVTGSLGYFNFDQYVMREARRRGVKTAAVIIGWDNTSTKGLPGARADYVVAWSEQMKRELVKYFDVRPEAVFVGGPAHYDLYAHPEHLPGREEFCARYGMDPERKIILFGTRSPNKFPWTGEYIRTMARAIEEGRLAEPCQLLVRLHPNHFQTKHGQPRYPEILAELEAVGREHRWVFFDRPEILSDRLACDLPASDMVKLGAILRHSAVMVNYFSTLMLEASIFDVPIINFFKHRHNVLLDPGDQSQRSFEHVRRVVEAGAETTACSDEELIGAINDYLRHPEWHREARRRVVEQELGPHLGRAGRRTADFLASLVGA